MVTPQSIMLGCNCTKENNVPQSIVLCYNSASLHVGDAQQDDKGVDTNLVANEDHACESVWKAQNC